MSFAVFLDIDGVLNSRTTCERTPDYHIGIDDLRVAVLAGAIKSMVLQKLFYRLIGRN